MSRQAAMRPVTVITGASSGIGRDIARLAAAEGEVLLVARGADGLAALADELMASGSKASWLCCDGSRPDAGAEVMAHLAGSGLYCHQLVNSAGFGMVGLAGVANVAEELASIDLNVRFLSELSLRVLPGMIQRREGGILSVGSVAGFLPGPGMAIYYATKAYVHSLSDSLWQEARGTGVRVTALAPGPVNTSFLARATGGARRAEKTLFHVDAAQVARQGWDGFKSGQRLIVPGWPNRVALLVAHFMPRAVMARLVMRRQQGRSNKS